MKILEVFLPCLSFHQMTAQSSLVWILIKCLPGMLSLSESHSTCFMACELFAFISPLLYKRGSEAVKTSIQRFMQLYITDPSSLVIAAQHQTKQNVSESYSICNEAVTDPLLCFSKKWLNAQHLPPYWHFLKHQGKRINLCQYNLSDFLKTMKWKASVSILGSWIQA